MLAPLLVFLASILVIAFAHPGSAGIRPADQDLFVPDRGFYLDRPAGAVLGALGMVICGGVSTFEAIHQAINYDTLLLLFGMMVVSAYMIEARLFRYVSWLTLTYVRSARRLLVTVVLVSGLLSAVLVNDTVCLMTTPLVVQCCKDAKLKPLPFLLAVCFGANAGSVATPTGNPQNMIIATTSGIAYTRFVLALSLPAIVSMLIVALVLLLLFRRDLPAGRLPPPVLSRPRFDPQLAALCLFTLCGIIVGFSLGYSLAWTAMFGAGLLLLLGRVTPRRILERVDYVLLVFFAGLFVVVYGIGKAGIAEALFHRLQPYFGRTALGQAGVFSAFAVAMSQLVSNVPFALLAGHWVPLFSDPKLMWLVTAMAATLAGNLTIVGSVANIIVLDTADKLLGSADGSQGAEKVGFWRFLRCGAVVTFTTLFVSLLLLYFERRFGLI